MRRRLRRATLAGGACLCGALALASTTASPNASPRPPSPALEVALAARGPAIPARFIGLSFEARELPQIARLASSGGLAGLLRSLGPGTLRFGGNSVDASAAWSDDGRTGPRWARTLITPHDLDGLAELARASGWNVLLAVTLGHPDAGAAAREVAAAKARLDAALAGVEIGNEPDQYVVKRLRRRPWDFARYRRQVDAYRTAIAAAAPGVPLAGPDLASAKPSSWLSSYARTERPSLLTAHFYPLARCHGARPTIGQLMSPDLHTAESRVLDRLVALARGARIPLRLGETNNIACRGLPGVSDRYDAALWTLDYLVRAMNAGLVGVNLHGFVSECRTYTPLCLEGGRLSERPEWFALRLASRLVDGRPLRMTGRQAPESEAVLAPDGSIELLLVDEAPTADSVALTLPAGFHATRALRLSGPALDATSGIRLTATTVAAARRLTVRVPGYGALLITATR